MISIVLFTIIGTLCFYGIAYIFIKKYVDYIFEKERKGK